MRSQEAELSPKTRAGLAGKAYSFLHRQQRDWKVTVARTSLDKLAYQMVFPYLSVYIVALGATATQLGAITSTGMIIAGLLGPFTGWLMDRVGPKKIYLVGISLLAISYLTYGLAHHWTTAVVAMIAYWLGFGTSVQSCATICGNCLANRDRATGMMICETVTAGILGMAGPVFATWLVRHSGGVNAAGIRPLFFCGLLITFGTFLLVLTQLSNRRWTTPGGQKLNLFKDYSRVFRSGNNLKRWLVVGTISHLPLAMIFPFSQVFAHQVKGADEFILGAMVTAAALTSIVFAITAGRVADRIGRKKVLSITIPAFWVSNLLLILAPSPVFLVVAGSLQGFYFIGTPISGAIERELVSPEFMGKWVGLVRFFRMISGALLAFTAGLIWDRLGPHYIFLTFIAIDLFVRVPLLVTIPETLHRKAGRG